MASPALPISTPSISTPSISNRREGLRAAMTYAGLASFAAVCVVYVMVRYVAFPRRAG